MPNHQTFRRDGGGGNFYNSITNTVIYESDMFSSDFNFLRLSFIMSKGLLLPLALVLVTIQPLLPLTSAALTVTSTFNQSGVMGTIKFTQANANAPTVMEISLTGTTNIKCCFLRELLYNNNFIIHACMWRKCQVRGAELHVH